MSFYNIYDKYRDFNFSEFFNKVTDEDIARALRAEKLSVNQLLALLSPRAYERLEDMAKRANRTTLQYFGKAIQLYTPMYLSNYCENQCSYCGFNASRDIVRRKLNLKEVEEEAGFIASTGLRHILILTGESRKESPLSYIKDCVRLLKKYFSSVSIEIYALTEEEYGELIEEGIDGLTIYQEVYDKPAYERLHLGGPKRDYRFRLDTPERASKKSVRSVCIGSLLGLGMWEREAFFTGLHAEYLRDKFPDTEISVSMPRVRPYAEGLGPVCEVTDKNLAQIIIAMRIFLPRVGITLSTRECSELRENLLPLGVTKISAGSTTKVGGHTIKTDEDSKPEQFEIYDKRNVADIKDMLLRKGYQPVLKDWVGDIAVVGHT